MRGPALGQSRPAKSPSAAAACRPTLWETPSNCQPLSCPSAPPPLATMCPSSSVCSPLATLCRSALHSCEICLHLARQTSTKMSHGSLLATSCKARCPVYGVSCNARNNEAVQANAQCSFTDAGAAEAMPHRGWQPAEGTSLAAQPPMPQQTHAWCVTQGNLPGAAEAHRTHGCPEHKDSILKSKHERTSFSGSL